MIMPDRFSRASALISPLILTLAHLAAAVALLGFGLRAGGYPFHPRALWLYWAAAPLALATIVWLAQRSLRSRPLGTLDLLLACAPALASLALVGTLWLSPWLGGAPYAPWDMQDYDAVSIFSQLPALAFVVIAVVYGSPGFLLAAGGAQLLVYFSTHALQNWSRWPGADLLGVNPYIALQLFSIYAVGLAAALLRRRLLPRLQPGLWLAAATAGLLGGFLLFSILSALPDNGAYLGYLATVPGTDALGHLTEVPGGDPRYLVPANAWDWFRPAALALAGLAIVSAVCLPLLALGRMASRETLVAEP